MAAGPAGGGGPSIGGQQPPQQAQVQEVAGGGGPGPMEKLQQSVMETAQSLGPQQTAQMLRDVADQIERAAPNPQEQAAQAPAPQGPAGPR